MQYGTFSDIIGKRYTLIPIHHKIFIIHAELEVCWNMICVIEEKSQENVDHASSQANQLLNQWSAYMIKNL